MQVTSESAKVYRGGGRRWFTLRAACRAEARAKMKARCECDYCDHPEMPGCPREDLPCSLHEPDRYPKIVRRLASIYYRAATTSKPNAEDGNG
jgi:hypothetical protein